MNHPRGAIARGLLVVLQLIDGITKYEGRILDVAIARRLLVVLQLVPLHKRKTISLYVAIARRLLVVLQPQRFPGQWPCGVWTPKRVTRPGPITSIPGTQAPPSFATLTTIPGPLPGKSPRYEPDSPVSNRRLGTGCGQ
jgi:hypothetical protein